MKPFRKASISRKLDFLRKPGMNEVKDTLGKGFVVELLYQDKTRIQFQFISHNKIEGNIK